ncbi:ABC transporter substrate-binding protein [Flavobacterium cyanobacteriorum]|uniref:ABC transporter substrate-binding protein n=1 Tax=Flavobacterium cyanobacteriorum TaxID=2022802 RepID=A0A255Z094_9FLAO|nr:ABC transporter substrate-binding protein [Flavobacterium cyanobacteriorum]OYQ34080.1 ABC transporter substrate-binding protein [Flavobacterium cyanobacteriorum]
MKNFISCLSVLVLLLIAGCKKQAPSIQDETAQQANTVKYARGLEIYRYEGYSIVKVTNPWPEAKETFTYVLRRNGVKVPDSLQQYPAVNVPLTSVVVTSTTHIPSLEMLGVENTLSGFPNTDFVSSENTRRRIDEGLVKEVGHNEELNTEILIDLSPDAVVGFSISSNNKTYNNLQKSGINVLYNGDWTEQSPLGKAEWIKFFGALYCLEEKAETLFNTIVKDYNEAALLAKKAATKPTVLSGAIYRDQWYLPQGNSWAALFIKDAHAGYLWADTDGTGSLNLSFEAVLDKAENADYWIGPGQFTGFSEMTDANRHYARFKAFKERKVYTFSSKKGAKGGVLYYELAPNRPDLVLKDLIAILHPELMPEYRLYFFEKLK